MTAPIRPKINPEVEKQMIAGQVKAGTVSGRKITQEQNKATADASQQIKTGKVETVVGGALGVAAVGLAATVAAPAVAAGLGVAGIAVAGKGIWDWATGNESRKHTLSEGTAMAQAGGSAEAKAEMDRMRDAAEAERRRKSGY